MFLRKELGFDVREGAYSKLWSLTLWGFLIMPCQNDLEHPHKRCSWSKDHFFLKPTATTMPLSFHVQPPGGDNTDCNWLIMVCLTFSKSPVWSGTF